MDRRGRRFAWSLAMTCGEGLDELSRRTRTLATASFTRSGDSRATRAAVYFKKISAGAESRLGGTTRDKIFVGCSLGAQRGVPIDAYHSAKTRLESPAACEIIKNIPGHALDRWHSQWPPPPPPPPPPGAVDDSARGVA